jgi:hypothetical protein
MRQEVADLKAQVEKILRLWLKRLSRCFRGNLLYRLAKPCVPWVRGEPRMPDHQTRADKLAYRTSDPIVQLLPVNRAMRVSRCI